MKYIIFSFISLSMAINISAILRAEAVKVKSIKVSSTLKPDTRYGAKKLFDGKTATAWVEGKKGDGIGESIIIYFKGIIPLSEIEIFNGLQKGKYFKMNNRVRDLNIESDAGSKWSFTVELMDKKGGQKVRFPSGYKAGWIKLTIESVYRGTRWRDTAISEIKFPVTGPVKTFVNASWASGKWHCRASRAVEIDYYVTISRGGKCSMVESRYGDVIPDWVHCRWHDKGAMSVSVNAKNRYGQGEDMKFNMDGKGECDGGDATKIQ